MSRNIDYQKLILNWNRPEGFEGILSVPKKKRISVDLQACT